MRLLRLRQSIALACASAMLASQVPVARAADVAQDIDVYALPARATSKPNVLIIIDNSSDWDKDLSGSVTACDEKKLAYANVTPPPAGSKADKSWPGWLVGRDGDDGTKGGALKCALYKVVKMLDSRGPRRVLQPRVDDVQRGCRLGLPAHALLRPDRQSGRNRRTAHRDRVPAGDRGDDRAGRQDQQRAHRRVVLRGAPSGSRAIRSISA